MRYQNEERLVAYIIVKELAFRAKVFTHTNPTVYAILYNLIKKKKRKSS